MGILPIEGSIMKTKLKPKAGLYIITNVDNKKEYIGKDVILPSRWSHHKSLLTTKTHHNSHLQSAWNKYGESCFTYKILEYVELRDKEEDPEGYLKDCKYLIGREKWWIDLLDLKNPNKGYNKLDPETGALGCRRSEELKARISASLMGHSVSEETRAKQSAAKVGHTPWNKGKKGVYSKESLEKMSTSKLGNQNRNKHIQWK